MNTHLSKRGIVDKILTSVVLGYNLDQEFSGHHLMPDVPVNADSGKIIKWGKEAFILTKSKRVPGETVRSVGVSYSSDKYVLEDRLLEAKVPVEYLEKAKSANIKLQSVATQIVYQKMRLEGEYEKSLLANDPDNYAPDNKMALSGTSLWSNPDTDVLAQYQIANSAIRAKTGKNANVFHLDVVGFENLQRNNHILEKFKYASIAHIGVEQLQQYFGVEKVVVAKSLLVDPTTGEFIEVWRDNSQLAYVPPEKLRNQAVQSFAYNYAHKDFPIVEKEYFDKSDRSLHNPVLFKDKAIITDSGAGFLFQNTSG